jgi:hypothetical protein
MPCRPLCFRRVIANQSQAVIRGLGRKLSFRPKAAHLPPQWRNPLFYHDRQPSSITYAPEASLAITSISTSASFGSPATATVDRAGGTTPSGARYFA